MLKLREAYRSCSELPLYNFIKIVVHGNLSFLYCEKKRAWNKNYDLTGLWEDIFSEYQSLTNDKQSIHILSLIKEITILNHELSIIQATVNFLNKHYDVRLCDMLRSKGFVFQYTPETLHNDLKLTISAAKTMLMQKKEAENELEKMNVGEKKVTEKDYTNLISQLSKFMGFKINPKETSVMEFVGYIEMFNYENQPKQHG